MPSLNFAFASEGSPDCSELSAFIASIGSQLGTGLNFADEDAAEVNEEDARDAAMI